MLPNEGGAGGSGGYGVRCVLVSEVGFFYQKRKIPPFCKRVKDGEKAADGPPGDQGHPGSSKALLLLDTFYHVKRSRVPCNYTPSKILQLYIK